MCVVFKSLVGWKSEACVKITRNLIKAHNEAKLP